MGVASRFAAARWFFRLASILSLSCCFHARHFTIFRRRLRNFLPPPVALRVELLAAAGAFDVLRGMQYRLELIDRRNAMRRKSLRKIHEHRFVRDARVDRATYFRIALRDYQIRRSLVLGRCHAMSFMP